MGGCHDSMTCHYKNQGEHNNAATWTNRLNGNIYWPQVIRVVVESRTILCGKKIDMDLGDKGHKTIIIQTTQHLIK
jgi:hypothetical protein